MTATEAELPTDQQEERSRLVEKLRELSGSDADGASAKARGAHLAHRIKEMGQSALEETRRASARLPLPEVAQRHLHHEPAKSVPDPVDGRKEPDDETWTLALAVGTYLVAERICEATGGDRGVKMARVVAKLRSSLIELLAEGSLESAQLDVVFLALVNDWPQADRIRLLIDLDFGDPFFPYSLKIKANDFEAALRSVAVKLGFGRDVVGEILETRRSAQDAHASVNWARVGIFGAGGMLLIGTGAFALAPIVGAALGTAAGLSGAAATSFGMALLGGGTLASGGAGMAGGLWLVTGIGVAAGLLGGGGSAGIYELGAKQVRIELTRLQVTFNMTLLTGQVDSLKAQAVLKSLDGQRTNLQTLLAEEQLLNDERSSRIKELTDKIDAVEYAVKWMNEQQEAAA